MLFVALELAIDWRMDQVVIHNPWISLKSSFVWKSLHATQILIAAEILLSRKIEQTQYEA